MSFVLNRKFYNKLALYCEKVETFLLLFKREKNYTKVIINLKA